MESQNLSFIVTTPLKVRPAQVRAARGLLEWNRPQAALECRVAVSTLLRLENGTLRPSDRTMFDIVDCFQTNGILFIETASGAGAMLKLQQDATV